MGGAEHLSFWWGFSAEGPPIHDKGRPSVGQHAQRLRLPAALQRVNFLPAKVFIVYIVFGELLFLFIMLFLINLNPVLYVL